MGTEQFLPGKLFGLKQAARPLSCAVVISGECRMSINLTLNDHPISMDSSPEAPLLWALREEKNLVGIKFGCGAGICGACTVIIDGQQTRSCLTRLADVSGKTVQTIEGLAGDVATAVTQAWIKAQAPQCGYCQPGFVMATTAVISADPKQSREQVLSQLTNICRCGAYDAIRLAVGYALDSLNGRMAPQSEGGAR
jgi:isoquinoline 1-oxidoreductase subunit alpha